MNVIYVSMMMPSKNANNAGAKTIYYYISRLAKTDDISVSLIAKEQNEKDKNVVIDGVKIIKVRNGHPTILTPLKLVKEINSKVNPFHKLGRTLRNSFCENVKKELLLLKEKPDIIIIEFTQMLFLVDFIREHFPTCRIIVSEHDVSFLRFERETKGKKGFFERLLWTQIYKKMKKDELKLLNKCDLVLPHNLKDYQILINNGIESAKIRPIAPYYEKMEIDRKPDYSTIIFYGAMGRIENQESVLWFVKNVYPYIKEEGIKFVVIGSNPSENIKKLENNDIIVTGFVDDLKPYFSKCLCMVAPLHFGAGIKVKVLEAMAAGIPTLTNTIGIEGIPAINGQDYFHCESNEDYVNIIKLLISRKISLEEISEKSKYCILNNFNLEQSFNNYIGAINHLKS